MPDYNDPNWDKPLEGAILSDMSPEDEAAYMEIMQQRRLELEDALDKMQRRLRSEELPKCT